MKAKSLGKQTATSAVDAAAVAVDATMSGGMPFASGAWGLTKVYLGRAIALRQQKALEWVEMIQQNPAVFNEKILKSNEFQDAFVVSIENYIKQRSSDKRSVLRAIFLDYSAFPDPESYPLEKMQALVEQISISEMKVFSSLVSQYHESIQDGAAIEYKQENLLDNEWAALWGLKQIGILRESTNRINIGGSPAFVISGLGVQFARYLT